MKSENVIRSPLLLFNFSLLTQYVLLFFCLKKDIKKDIKNRHKKRESSQTPNLH
jgi:hypothetical protein